MIKIDQAKAQAAAKAKRIAELQGLLASTDHKVALDYDKPNDDIKVQRQAWRDEIRALKAAA